MFDTKKEVSFEGELGTPYDLESSMREIPELFHKMQVLKEPGENTPFSVGHEILQVQDRVVSIVSDANYFRRFARENEDGKRLRKAIDKGLTETGYFIPAGEYTDPFWIEGKKAHRTFYADVKDTIQRFDWEVSSGDTIKKGYYCCERLSDVLEYVGSGNGMLQIKSLPEEKIEAILASEVELAQEMIEVLLERWRDVARDFQKFRMNVLRNKELEDLAPVFDRCSTVLYEGSSYA